MSLISDTFLGNFEEDDYYLGETLNGFIIWRGKENHYSYVYFDEIEKGRLPTSSLLPVSSVLDQDLQAHIKAYRKALTTAETIIPLL